MRSKLFVITAVFTLLAALLVAGFAYAQVPTPTTPGSFYGNMGSMMGHMGGNGMGGHMSGSGMMGGQGMMGQGFGPMHEYMLAAFAEALGITPEDLQARLDAGESMWDVALAEGLTEEQAAELMQQAHDEAVAQAVADGVITQEQADWMNQHHTQMHGNGTGFGACHGSNAAPAGNQSTN